MSKNYQTLPLHGNLVYLNTSGAFPTNDEFMKRFISVSALFGSLSNASCNDDSASGYFPCAKEQRKKSLTR
jgi:hypothetical protein